MGFATMCFNMQQSTHQLSQPNFVLTPRIFAYIYTYAAYFCLLSSNHSLILPPLFLAVWHVAGKQASATVSGAMNLLFEIWVQMQIC